MGQRSRSSRRRRSGSQPSLQGRRAAARRNSKGSWREQQQQQHHQQRRTTRGSSPRRRGGGGAGGGGEGGEGRSSSRRRQGGTVAKDVSHFVWKRGMVLGSAGRYVVEDLLGEGTFGRVLACADRVTNSRVAVKVVKGIKRFCEHAEAEAEVLSEILQRDPKREGLCVAMWDAFLHGRNYCIVFEPLDVTLRDFLKGNGSRGLLISDVREIAEQLLRSLGFLHSLGVTHTDLKCRNVMLQDGSFDLVPHPRATVGAVAATVAATPNAAAALLGDVSGSSCSTVTAASISSPSTATTRRLRSRCIRVIDFGGAVFPEERHSGRIGTRQFRAPEVVLGLPWDETSDLWSAGCIVAMLYLGERLFSVHEDMEHLAMMQHVLRSRLPLEMVREAESSGVLPEAVKSDPVGQLLWPACAPSLEAVQRVSGLRGLRSRICDRHHPLFDSLLKGLLEFKPQRRLAATAALLSEFFRSDLPE